MSSVTTCGSLYEYIPYTYTHKLRLLPLIPENKLTFHYVGILFRTRLYVTAPGQPTTLHDWNRNNIISGRQWRGNFPHYTIGNNFVYIIPFSSQKGSYSDTNAMYTLKLSCAHPRQGGKYVTDIHDFWWHHQAIERVYNAINYNFLQSVVSPWRMRKLVRWERHFWHILRYLVAITPRHI
jgi:hypothetical protein